MSEKNKLPDFLVIGHVTKDLLAEGGFTLGGTATYASVTARNLGRRVGVVTSAAADLDLSVLLEGIQVVKRPSKATTTFQNIYVDRIRQQFVKSVAEPISAEGVPLAWRAVPIVLLGPLVRELSVDIARLFPHSLLGVTAQGWMRQWDGDGRVSTRFWEEAEEVLSFADVLFFSYEDVGYDVTLAKRYASLAKSTVITDGRGGAVVCCTAGARWVPAYQAKEVDPTGAGDVFAAAYLVALEETGDPYEAARFANSTASFSIEGKATSAIPSRHQVEERLRYGTLIELEGAQDELIGSVCRRM